MNEPEKIIPGGYTDFLNYLDTVTTEEALFSRLTYWFANQNTADDARDRFDMVEDRAKELKLWNGLTLKMERWARANKEEFARIGKDAFAALIGADYAAYRDNKPQQPAPDCIRNVQTKAVQWLAPGLLPLGEVSLLGADGGTGKGIWQAQLIAYVTTGKTSGFFPVPPPKTGNVLVLTGEDDPSTVLKARYIAAGADLNKIFVMSSDKYFDKAGRLLTIKDAVLADYAVKYDPLLLIIDPLQGFLPEDVEMGSRNQMRSAIVPLRGISKRQNCAALISMHSNKKQGVSGRARLADSSDIWDIARSVLMMGRSKNDGKIYLSHEKASYSAPQQTVLLHIEDTSVEGVHTARAVFDGYTDKRDADFIEEKRFRMAQTKDDTAAAILNTLAECKLGSMVSSELRAAVIQETGCSQGTYNRAYGELVKSGEIEKFVINQPGGVHGWFTRLPLQSETSDKVTK